jgi:hypothetical protein
MKMGDHAGFMRNELIVVITVVALAALAMYPVIRWNIETVVATSMKSRSRGIWVAIASANAERATVGLTPLWPRELGFDAARTSTDYFRQLMSDSNGVIAVDHQHQACADLSPSFFDGAGVACADSAASFSRVNNAWNVLCVGEETSSEVPFCITRNVDWGRQASTSSLMSLNHELPFRQRRAVWMTRGGGCFDARVKYLPGLRDSIGTNVVDVMRP